MKLRHRRKIDSQKAFVRWVYGIAPYWIFAHMGAKKQLNNRQKKIIIKLFGFGVEEISNILTEWKSSFHEGQAVVDGWISN